MVNVVALTSVDVRAAPFHQTDDELINPVPVIVSVKAGLPAKTEFGVKLTIVGGGFGWAIVRFNPAEVPPPGAGLNTVMIAVPVLAMSAAVICAVNCVALTNCVVRALPFQRTTEPLMKFAPVTVSVKAAPPAFTVFGLKLVSVGVGFGWAIVKAVAFEVPPPGVPLKTVTCAVPALAISAAVICAVNCVALTNVVVRALPFHRTTEPFTKPVPLTVNVNAASPACAEVGFTLVIAGVGLLIVKGRALVVPPPGAGF